MLRVRLGEAQPYEAAAGPRDEHRDDVLQSWEPLDFLWSRVKKPPSPLFRQLVPPKAMFRSKSHYTLNKIKQIGNKTK